jgi:mRNA-degrading endonuclease toxin of MazEF toxin-antitoxin module
LTSYPAPAPGDIVWSRFPERGSIHPAKARPALVLSVMDEADPLRVRVAYGTSRRTEDVATTEVRIGPENAAAYKLSGLSRPTKFCMKNVVVLDFTALWFDRAPGRPIGPDPRMGVLHPSLLPAVKAALIAARII